MFKESRTDYNGIGQGAARTNPATVAVQSNPVTSNLSSACQTTSPPVSTRDRTAYSYGPLGDVLQTTHLAANQTTGPSTQAVFTTLETTTCDEKLNATTRVTSPLTRTITVYQPPAVPGTTCAAPNGTPTTPKTTDVSDALGRLTQVTDPNGNVATYQYDMAGRRIDAREPDLGHWTYTYADTYTGPVKTQTDARGVKTTLTYDLLNRLTSKAYVGVTPPDGGSIPTVTDHNVTYSYDQQVQTGDGPCGGAATGIGRLAKIADGAGSQYDCYDARGNETHTQRTVNGIAYDTYRTFDALGDAALLTYPDGEQTTYAYGRDTGSLSGVTTQLRSGSSTSLVSQAYLTPWGAPGGFVLGDRAANPNVETTRYAYDYRERPMDIQTATTLNGANDQHLAVGYDDAGNVTTMTDKMTGEVDQYTYDQLNRVTAMTIDGIGAASYGYDPSGNLLSKTESGAGMSNTTTISQLVYPTQGANSVHPHAVIQTQGTPTVYLAYDSAGNLCATSATALSTGCATGGANTYAYDAENRLKTRTVTTPTVSTVSYTYDGNGELVQRTNNADGSYVVYVGGIYEETRNASNAVTGVIKYYQAFGRKVAMRQAPDASGTSSTALDYLLADHLGSTVGAVDASTGAVASQKYWPFGGVRSGAVALTDKQYTGQQQEPGDATLGLYYYHARFYSTTVGRFASADTMSADGPNRYTYVADNPMRNTDPTGHRWVDDSGGGSGSSCDLCNALVALYNAGITSPDTVAQNEAASSWASQAPAPPAPGCDTCDALRALAAEGIHSPDELAQAWASASPTPADPSTAPAYATPAPEHHGGGGWGFGDLVGAAKDVGGGVASAAQAAAEAVPGRENISSIGLEGSICVAICFQATLAGC